MQAASTTREQAMAKQSTRWWLRGDEASSFVAAPADHLYGLVADLPRMGEWSPECHKVEWIEGADGPAVGARFVGHNKNGLIKWSRRGRVVEAVPGQRFAFVTEEGGKEGTTWSYRFEPTEGGTVVTESYEVGTLPAWARIVDVPTNRAGELRAAIRHTLDQLKLAAEAQGDR
jgi:Polyketide cyclase / dehydrase and lipid transport